MICCGGMAKSPIGLLRKVALAEGVSFLLLLGVAMPLKYAAGMPMAVRIVGLAHGLLFIAVGWLALKTVAEVDWPYKRAAMVIVASLLPFGPFVIDGRLKREQAAIDDE